MLDTYVWLLLFAGATVALLGILLLTSERQLRKKGRELEAIALAHSDSIPSRNAQDFETQSSARQQELLDKISLLSKKLEESQSTISELQAEQRGWASADSDNQHEQTIINLKAQLQASASQLSESAVQARENAERNLQLQSELGELALQQQANQATIAELQAEQERILQNAQSDKQNLCAENQHLQWEIAELRSQVQTTDALLGTKSGEYTELMKRHAQLQSDVGEIKQQLDDLTLKNNALSEEKDALLSKLAHAQKTIEELRMLQDTTQSENQRMQTGNQELQRELAKLNLDLESIQSRFDEAERQAHVSGDRYSKLEREAGELKEQLRASQNTIEQFQANEERWAAIALENQKVRQQCAGLCEQLQGSDSRLSELTRLNQESADQYARLKGDAADLARRLEERESQISEFHSLQQELASVQSREMILKRRQDEQQAQIASLQRELSDADGKVQQLAMARNRLAEVERLYQELRDEQQRLQQENSRQESRDSRNETPNETDVYPEPLDESEHQHAPVVELNHQELRLSASNADNKHILQSTTAAGGELAPEPVERSVSNPLPPLLDPVSPQANSPTAGPADSGNHRAPVHPADDDFCIATAMKQLQGRKKSRAAVICAIIVFAVAGGGAAGVLGTRYFTSTDALVTREFMPDERSTSSEAISQTAEPKPVARLHGKFKIVSATEVYSGPTEKSALITRIEPGIKINVVDSRDGWLQIRSKYGRPPGFVREETAVKID